MAHILMLTPQVPYPPKQGTALRNWGMLHGLAQHHSVSLLSFAAPDQDGTPPQPLLDLVEHVAILPQPTRTMKDRVRDLLTNPRPDLTLRLRSTAFKTQLTTWLETIDFDWVQVEGIELAPYLDHVWDSQQHPNVVFDDHNCEYLLQKRAARTDWRRPTRWAGAAYSSIQWRRLRRYETDVCTHADLVIAVSENDAKALRELVPNLRPLVIPNGIMTAEYTRSGPQATLEQPAFVFTGTMDFRPNVDGALWFAHQVWPKIRQTLPNAHFYIVGRRPHRRLEALRKTPGIVITGSVPDTKPYIRAATVFVVPLWVGGGTRLKILEAAAMGKVIVSTSLGAEGFPNAKQAVVLADTPDTFADACIRLAKDPTVSKQHIQQVTAFAEQYDWAMLLPPLLKALS